MLDPSRSLRRPIFTPTVDEKGTFCFSGKAECPPFPSARIKRFDMPGWRPSPAYVREMKRCGALPTVSILRTTRSTSTRRMRGTGVRSGIRRQPQERAGRCPPRRPGRSYERRVPVGNGTQGDTNMSDCTAFKSKSLFLPTALAVLLTTSGGTPVRAADAVTPGEFVVERPT